MDVGDREGLPVQIGLYSLPDSLDLSNQMVRRQLADPSDDTIKITKVTECVVQSGEDLLLVNLFHRKTYINR